MLLTVDLGNSRLKLVLWERAPDGEPLVGERAELAALEGGEERLAAWLAARDLPPRAALSSVAAPELTERFAARLAARVEELLVAPDSGLENRCRVPEKVGLDRLYAARGALARAPEGAVVVDAGTALTVDAVVPLGGGAPPAAPGAPVGAFLGGAIAPGPALLAGALARGAARLPLVEPQPAPELPGRDTEAAIRAGVGIGFRGAARALALELAAAVGLEGAPVVVTGGAAPFLLAPEPVLPRLLYVPELVHLGLFQAARDAERSRA